MKKALFLPSYLGSGFGHIGRCLSLAGELKARGWRCDFAVAGIHAGKVRRVGHAVYEPRYPFRPKPRTIDGPAFTVFSDMNFQLVRDRFESPRVVRASVRETQRLIKHFQPDVLIGDTWPLTHIIGKLTGIPVVQIIKSVVHPASPRLIWWEDISSNIVSPDVQAVFNPVLRNWGLSPIQRAEDLLAGDLLLVPSIPELDPLPTDLPSTRYVGALTWADSLTDEWKDWFESLPQDRPLIYVTLGGGADHVGGIHLFQVLFKALEDLPLQVVVSTSTRFESSDLPTPPKNFLLKKWIPGQAMTNCSNMVIFHGGYGTMMESALCGVPSISIPFHSEQESNGRRLQASGVGIVIRHSDGPYEPMQVRWKGGILTMMVAARSTLMPSNLRQAVKSILSDESFRQNATRLRRELLKYRGPSLAADHLEKLV